MAKRLADPPLTHRRAPAGHTLDDRGHRQPSLHERELATVLGRERPSGPAAAGPGPGDRELAGAAALEEERQWVALEVHDRIAQPMVSVFHLLQRLESLALPDPQARQLAVRASVLLRDAIRECRNVMNDLEPPLLDELGVIPLMKEELRQFQEETGCRVRFKAGPPLRLPRDVEVALYRVFREALTNVRRHAQGARNVAVGLVYRGHVLTLQVQDDGPGFDIEAVMRARRGGGGLAGIQRRAGLVGGTAEVMSTPGQGTRVTFRVPALQGITPV